MSSTTERAPLTAELPAAGADNVPQPEAVSVPAKAKSKADYSFVTNVRFISMIGIVTIHAEVLSIDWTTGYLNVALDQALKFATVCFFLISGFLLGDRLEEQTPLTYMRRRLSTTFAPWAVWSSVYLVMSLALDWLARGAAMRSFGYHLSNTVISSAYWFVPNILLSLATLLMFRRWLNERWFGLVLGVASISYGLNLYPRWWSDTRHNTAFAGFIVFLWLGYQLRRNLAAVRAFVAARSWATLTVFAVVTYALSMFEARTLAVRYGAEFDYLSTLRLSNVAYSFAIFALIFKVQGRLEPRAMNVRQQTFGIYLLHPISFALVARVFKVLAARALGVPPLYFNEHIAEYLHDPWLRLGTQVVLFLLVYLSSWAGVLLLSRTPMARYIGVRE